MQEKVGQTNGFSFMEAVVAIGVLLVLGLLLFPAVPGCCPESAVRVHARNDIVQLVTAVRAYRSEYGRFPLTDHGTFSDEGSQARLLKVLQGVDDKENPHRIAFFEARTAKPKRRWWIIGARQYRAGLHPESGTLLDPWGKPYRILFDADSGGQLQSPYEDDEKISTSVIAWSLGKDGVQGSPSKENIRKDSDDIVSWH